MIVRFSPAARSQYFDGLRYIRRDRPAAARRFHERVKQVQRRIEEYPDSGRTIPEFPGLPHREVIVKPYRFFYRVVGDVVWIVAVWHEAQDAAAPGE